MANPYFKFKKFTIQQDRCAMKVTTDACLLGAWAADKIEKIASPISNVLDIGTGTGLLSLMLAQKKSGLAIDAIELDAAAAIQAQENITSSSWKENITVWQGDAREMAFTLAKEFDIVISNPPFYENELTSADAKKNIAHHESGLLVDELLQIISGVLAPEGSFFLLLPYKRMMEAGLLFQKNHLAIIDTTLVRQSTSHDFFRILVSGKRSSEDSIGSYSKNEISICDADRQYTNEFTALLKDYYLYL
jgi:tRNA1Val (adenine37-N6)-methyltransferase